MVVGIQDEIQIFRRHSRRVSLVVDSVGRKPDEETW